VFSIHGATFIQHFVQQTVKVSVCNVIGRGVDDVLLLIVERRFDDAARSRLQALRSDVEIA